MHYIFSIQWSICRLLFQLKRGASIEKRSGLGYTPLHVTAHYDRVGVAKLLLEAGVNPDEEDFQVSYFLLVSALLSRGRGPTTNLIFVNRDLRPYTMRLNYRRRQWQTYSSSSARTKTGSLG